MSAKTSERRKQAFFTALAETGNQTISAERARVARSWVTLHRSTHPAFKARMEAAIAEARERLSRAGAVTPDQCLSLLRMNKDSAFRHWAQKRGLHGWGHNRNAEMSHEEVTASLLEKLSVLRKRIDAGEA